MALFEMVQKWLIYKQQMVNQIWLEGLYMGLRNHTTHDRMLLISAKAISGTSSIWEATNMMKSRKSNAELIMITTLSYTPCKAIALLV